jgi:plastocyanin
VRTRRLLPAALLVAAFAVPAGARADTESVSIEQSAFTPPQTAALVGDTVSWRNGSLRDHTVTTLDDSFGSLNHIAPGGFYSASFARAGDFPYYCTIHPGMKGEVDVYPVLLEGPPHAVSPGDQIPMTGRAAAGTSTVSIERDSGAGFAPVATAAVDGMGMYTTSVPATTTAVYRAVGSAGTSQTVQVVVVDRKIQLRASRGLARVHVSPLDSGATVILQVWLRERFGWFPVAQRRLDRRSNAAFPIRHRGRRARAVLVLPDGYTPVAMSDALRLPRR